MTVTPERIDLKEMALLVEQGSVIPVLGRELYRVPDEDGEETSLESLLARRLAEALGLPGPFQDLNRVAAAWAAKGGNPNALHSRLRLEWEEMEVPVPKAVEQLARIDSFSLYCTTTFDDLLERALSRCRPQGQGPGVSLAFAKHLPVQDLPSRDVIARTLHVFHLFGTLTGQPTCALTDDDALEFAHDLLEQKPKLGNFFLTMRNSNLLFLGCGFHDWLARFFLRVMRNEPWANHRPGWEMLADGVLPEEQDLAVFLSRNGARVWTEGQAVQLVDALHAQWTRRRERKPRPGSAPPSELVIEDAVFLSYAREDQECVRAMASQLRANGLPVWMDELRLREGERYESTIRSVIKSCSVFVPVISRHTEARGEGWYFREWNWGDRYSDRFSRERRFIRPVCLGEIDPGTSMVPEGFRELNWTFVEAGCDPEGTRHTCALPSSFIDGVRQAIRERRGRRKGFA